MLWVIVGRCGTASEQPTRVGCRAGKRTDGSLVEEAQCGKTWQGSFEICSWTPFPEVVCRFGEHFCFSGLCGSNPRHHAAVNSCRQLLYRVRQCGTLEDTYQGFPWVPLVLAAGLRSFGPDPPHRSLGSKQQSQAVVRTLSSSGQPGWLQPCGRPHPNRIVS